MNKSWCVSFDSLQIKIKDHPIKILKTVFISILYLVLLIAYLANDFNRHLLGVVLDSFWLTGVSVIYVIFLLKITGRQLGPSYFKIRQNKLSSVLYFSLGVKLFKKIVRKYPFPWTTRKIILTGTSITAIRTVEDQMKEAEEIHVYGLILNIVLALVFGVFRDIRFLFWLTFFNVFMNMYPILLQRYNRNRVEVLLEKYAAKSKARGNETEA